MNLTGDTGGVNLHRRRVGVLTYSRVGSICPMITANRQVYSMIVPLVLILLLNSFRMLGLEFLLYRNNVPIFLCPVVSIKMCGLMPCSRHSVIYVLLPVMEEIN